MKSNNKKTRGGETHQTTDQTHPVLTTNQGIHISDNQNSLKSGARGPVLLEDFVLREKIFHFDHERIPERIVHARGSAAHGYFELFESLADITKADIFNGQEKRHLCLQDFPPLQVAQVRWTHHVMFADSL